MDTMEALGDALKGDMRAASQEKGSQHVHDPRPAVHKPERALNDDAAAPPQGSSSHDLAFNINLVDAASLLAVQGGKDIDVLSPSKHASAVQLPQLPADPSEQQLRPEAPAQDLGGHHQAWDRAADHTAAESVVRSPGVDKDAAAIEDAIQQAADVVPSYTGPPAGLPATTDLVEDDRLAGEELDERVADEEAVLHNAAAHTWALKPTGTERVAVARAAEPVPLTEGQVPPSVEGQEPDMLLQLAKELHPTMPHAASGALVGLERTPTSWEDTPTARTPGEHSRPLNK